MSNVKLKLVVILLMILNVIYYALSEVYIHDGEVFEGFVYGLITSFLSLAFGVVIGSALKINLTKRG